ncbi:asparaginase domain-containing protein [Devosia sp. XJ19-1]|uniref:Asparaginase domain-containing protein n=2 Tax=Devosia ureilytica TaxID=2952754 RepID=A0A9Q4AKW9_9HYPH|nr:asparaginase domain-containing protein [Devosia ureilytica]MCP8885719.1 asparaginase domain-containing protein [Devosia ureilytica]
MMPEPHGGIVPVLDGARLIAAVPRLAEIAAITVETPFLVPGASLSFAQLRHVSRCVAAGIASGAQGVVVVQGTDTIDETAFLLGLAHAEDAPLVVTGAMRGAAAAGADGPANLLAAISVAAAETARGLGALVVLNDEIHAAALVEKSHKSLPSAFTSPSAGPLGAVIEDRVRILLRPQHPQPLGAMPELARVAMLKPGLGDDGELIKAAAALGYAGLVIEGMGAGHVPAALLAALEALPASLPIVLASRVPAGPVFEKTYGFAGSERDLIARGLIPAGVLSAPKARLLLAFLVAQGRDHLAIAEFFSRYA